MCIHIKDHLGNVRLSYKNTSNTGVNLQIVEENNYYPFGLTHEGYNNVQTADHGYKFNGKEHNQELGLDWYDFGARNYDASLGRWMNVDPLSNSFPWNSQYAFSENRVIDGIELEGLEYLDKDVALINVKLGVVYMKIENFDYPYRKAFEETHGSNAFLVQYGKPYALQVTSQLFKIEGDLVPHKNLSSVVVTDVEGANISQQKKMPIRSAFEKTISHKYKGITNASHVDKRLNPQLEKNWKQTVTVKTKQVTPGQSNGSLPLGGAGVVVNVFNYAMTTYAGISASKDSRAFYLQSNGIQVNDSEEGVWKYEKSVFEKSYDDVKKALANGNILGFDIEGLSQIMNYVIYGGDGNESAAIKAAGRLVISLYSHQSAKDRLQQFKYLEIFKTAQSELDSEQINENQECEDNCNEN
jgi:RHS repeat-associated protein